MRAFYLIGVIGLAFLPVPNSASPLPGPGRRCANAPNVIAGTFLNRRSLISTSEELNPRGDRRNNKSIIWCAPATRAYIILSPFAQNPNVLGVSSNRIASMLTDAVIEVNEYLARFGDGVLSEAPGLIYTFTGVQGDRRSELNITQRAGKRISYTVLRAVLSAMYEYMNRDSFRAAAFSIWVGTEQVGTGKLS